MTMAEGATALPSGTITFAFTDIEGSTKRWDRDRLAMQDAVRRHDAIVRDAIESNGGRVFKTIGDAFCAAFHRPEDAVLAMLHAQRALTAEDFSAVNGVRIRAAIHLGTADERDGDYFGPTVNRVARLLAIGHGGQVLISGAVVEALGAGLPAPLALRDLGTHYLKDLERPENVYQLLAPELPAEFPKLASLGALRNNLPAGLPSLVGRDAEIHDITDLLGAYRIVTLVGAGGVGKTRVSLQVGANILDGSGDGVWFIELAPITNGDHLAFTVAQAMDLHLGASGDANDKVVHALQNKNVLLILDNCEHIIESTGALVAALVRRCPKLRILASSRQVMGIAGEVSYRMPSLPIPPNTMNLTAADASRYSSVALFSQRASAVDQRFVLTDENAPFVAEVCRRLDGIPLAIELAAARVKILTPRQLRDHLDERFRILTAGARDTLPRHRTLRALIDWSHDLLASSERAVFRRLGIFVNGFTLEAAVAVAASEDIDSLEVIGLLDSLVDKSLVISDAAGDHIRCRLLESTRAYAVEKLEHAGEVQATAAKHVRYFADVFSDLRDHYEQTGETDTRGNLLRAELEDVRFALSGALERAGVSDREDGARLAAALGNVWEELDLYREGVTCIDAFLAVLPESNAALRSRLLTAAALLLSNQRRWEDAASRLESAIVSARESGDVPALADALILYVTTSSVLGRLADAQDAMQSIESMPNLLTGLRLRALHAKAFLLGDLGEHEEAAKLQERLRSEYRARGNARRAMLATINAAEGYRGLGNFPRAIELANEVVSQARLSGETEKFYPMLALGNLAEYRILINDCSGAKTTAREVIDILATTEPASPSILVALEVIGLAFAIEGDTNRAAALAGYIEATRRREGITEEVAYGRLSTLLREQVASSDLDTMLAAGSQLSPESAIALARA